MNITQKIALSMTVWTGLCVALVGPYDVELFGILLLIGLLITRELTSTYTKPETALRMDSMIYVGIVFFIAVVAHRILSILEIL